MNAVASRRWRYAVITATAVVGVWTLFWAPDPAIDIAGNGSPQLSTRAPTESESPAPAAVDAVTPAPLPAEPPDLITQAKQYDLNLVELFDEVRNRCLPEWDRAACNTMTRQFLQERTPDNGKDELLAVFDQYVAYEDHVASQRALQGLDLESTYQTLRQLRSLYFDPEVRAWLFGPEDARMTYEFSLRDFMANDALKLPALARLQALEKLRQAALGDYYPLFVSREPRVDYYQLQLEVLALENPPSPETAAYAQVIRDKMRTIAEPAR